MKIAKLTFLVLACINLACVNPSVNSKNINFNTSFINAEKQMSLLLKDAEQANRIPRTLNEHGHMHWTNTDFDWTEGFFPGSCWFLYEQTKNRKWKNAAEKFQLKFESHKTLTTNHDLGFVFNCSYGKGYELTKNEHFKEILITAANSLLTRFNPTVGCIKSWDVNTGWQAERGWKYPVIIDNMMNLELLFKVSEFTGNNKYKQAAITHANTTLNNHFRNDNSSVHVVDYDPVTGEVRGKYTAQGFANESSWARGQAWGLYGYTVCYRFTKDTTYLHQAEKIAQYILNFNGTPDDGIPYWDYHAPKIPNEPRDVSAASITASALLELNKYSKNNYLPAINKIMASLGTKEYTASIGKNKHFILKHSVGSIPHGNEIDVPLNYADYYYLEALSRYKSIEQ
ncbi:glucuronyl hydrolase [Seonamhaeicola algicola]|uniref:Glucuronyl hydrolase n=1 Tax=Seonamhaeicola algicola TaxID=1719036 RepID=A0A5C7AKI3_9FLAO|nr:glycoside hydrolase family 88 protein [Seonamhaeicola algicola]TXE06292.1 glucuronyl hydrolase [Seonamhaeicola algicola]